MASEDELIEKLMEEHKDDFPSDDSATNQGSDDTGDSDGGDNSEDNPTDEVPGTEDSPKNDDAEQTSEESKPEGDEAQEDKDGSDEPDDSNESGTEPVGEKKDANSRIRQLIETNKAAEKALEEARKQLAEREAEARKAQELVEDPVYTLDDFIGTVDEEGNPLTDGEATARFRAWEADYKLRQYEKQQVMKEQQATLLSLQRETRDAFTKFPEFDVNSDTYDPELAAIANDAFRGGLIYETGFDGDDNHIIGSRINPGELLEKLHHYRAKDKPITKVNKITGDDGNIVSSKQVNKRTNKYAPGFRGEVDKELDKLMEKENK